MFATYLFVGVYVGYVCLLFLAETLTRPRALNWPDDEREVIRKYHLALMCPPIAGFLSDGLNGLRFGGLAWAIFLVCSSHWFLAALMVAMFFATTGLEVRLDAFWYLENAVKGGQTGYYDELVVLQRVRAMSNLAYLEHGAESKTPDQS